MLVFQKLRSLGSNVGSLSGTICSSGISSALSSFLGLVRSVTISESVRDVVGNADTALLGPRVAVPKLGLGSPTLSGVWNVGVILIGDEIGSNVGFDDTGAREGRAVGIDDTGA